MERQERREIFAHTNNQITSEMMFRVLGDWDSELNPMEYGPLFTDLSYLGGSAYLYVRRSCKHTVAVLLT
jgi:hypothetical protein